ncbi:MAG: GNAT family N-acetyltransferase [Rhizobiales bacterium]|nr:GNAT family N-acetyltransferase [Hyphomicrobiales bacterium]
MKPPFVTEPLNPDHDRSAFHSGSDSLDRYFKERASQDVRRRVAGCFVAVDQDKTIAGFYTLAAASVALDALPREMAKALPRYPVVPVMLVGRLAVATTHQGKGLGSALIADAIIRTDRFGIGAFAMMVDAKDEHAAAFYQASGFTALPGQGRRLCLPIATALRLLQD